MHQEKQIKNWKRKLKGQRVVLVWSHYCSDKHLDSPKRTQPWAQNMQVSFVLCAGKICVLYKARLCILLQNFWDIDLCCRDPSRQGDPEPWQDFLQGEERSVDTLDSPRQKGLGWTCFYLWGLRGSRLRASDLAESRTVILDYHTQRNIE